MATRTTERTGFSEPGQVRGLAHLAVDLIPVSAGLLAFNLAYYVSALGLAFGAIALFFAHPAWWTFVIAFVVVSSRQQAILNCEHECAHRKFVRGRRGNDVLGTWATGALVGSPYGVAKANHLAHHRLLGTPDDPDRKLHDDTPPRDTRWGVIGHFARGLLAAYAVMVLFDRPAGGDSSNREGKLRDAVAIVAVQGLLLVVFTLAFGAWWGYFALWVAPLITLTTLSHLIRSYAEHAITAGESTGGHANRLITIRSNLLERALIAPYWMNLHAEHHLLPSVPAPRLRRLRARLHEDVPPDALPPVLERTSYGAALRRCLGALKR